MALNNENKSLVQFGYGYNDASSKVAGMLSFDASRQAIYVGDGDKANLVTSSVKDATYVDNVLTITKIDGSTYTLNFSDVASAKTTMAVFTALDTSIKANATAISNLDTTISDLDASIREDFAAADASIREDFAAADASINEELIKVKATAEAAQTAEEVESAINTKISALGGSGEDVDDSSFVKVAVVSSNGEVTGVTVTTTDIASATELARVAGRVDTFLDTTGVEKTVDTLKDIQAWIEGDGVNATELTQAIAEEASTRAAADEALGTRINGVEATANAAAVKTSVDASLNLKADKSQVTSDISTAKGEAISAAATDASTKASNAESNAKTYADAIKVNGVSQTNQEVTISGVNIKVGGTGTHKESNIDIAIEDLYGKVGEAIQAAGVTSVSVGTDSSNYASVNTSTGAVSLTIKKVTLADASETKTGVADAYDVKTSIATAKSDVVGTSDDASNASTVYGAKKYASDLNDAMDTRMSDVEAQLMWNVLS